MNVLIMGSAGVESTRLITHAIENDIQFDVAHVVHNNRSDVEMTQLQKICHDKKIPLYRVDVKKDSFDKDNQRQHRDTACWLPPAMMLAARGAYDQVWFGCHRHDHLNEVQDIFGVFNLMMKSIAKTTTLQAPLMMETKKKQYMNVISHGMHEHLVWCQYDPLKPCGECGKCREFNRYVGVDYENIRM